MCPYIISYMGACQDSRSQKYITHSHASEEDINRMKLVQSSYNCLHSESLYVFKIMIKENTTS